MTFVIPNRVRPGDLIRAEDWNTFVDDVAALDARLRLLESLIPGADGRIAITGLPGEIHVGDPLVIEGVNFGVPAENTVMFNGANRVTDFLAGTDRMLALRVPAISVPATGLDMTLLVSNATRGSASRSIKVLPFVDTVPQGQFTAVGPAQFPNVSTLASGGPAYVLAIPIEIAGLTLDETFTLTPSGPPGWPVKMVTDIDGTADLVPPVVPISRTPDGQLFARSTVFLKFNIPGGIVGKPPATLTLRTQGVHNQQLVNDAAFGLTVNDVPPGASLINMTVTKVFPNNATIGAQPAQVVSYPLPTPPLSVLGTGGSLAMVNLQTNSIGPGSYTYTLTQPPSGSGWQVSLSQDPAAWPVVSITPKERTTSGVQDIAVFVLGAAGAVPASFTLKVTGPGTGNTGTRTQSIKGLP